MAEQPDVQTQQEMIEEELRDEPEPQKQEAGNGNGARTHQVAAPIMEKVTRSYVQPIQAPRQAIRGFPQFKAETEKQRNSRQVLEDLMQKPEANNYKLGVHRFLPARTESGADVPRGKLYECAVMPLDDLREEIISAWGGGEYKIIVSEDDGSPVKDMAAFVVSVPVTMHPVKLRKFEGTNEATISAPQTPELEELERMARDLEIQSKMDLLGERKAQAEQRRNEAEIRAEIRRKDLEKLRRESLGNSNSGNEMLIAMQAQMAEMNRQVQQTMKEEREAQAAYRKEVEQQRREDYERAEKRREDTERLAREERLRAEQTAKEERAKAEQTAREERKAIEDQIRADRDAAKAEREAAERRAEEDRKLTREMFAKLAEKPQDNSMKDFFVLMQQISTQKEEANARLLAAKEDSSNKLLAAVLPALTAPKQNEDGKIYELMKINNEANRVTMDMAMRRENKENSTQQQLMQTLMAAVLNPKRDSMGPDVILRLIGEGRNQAKEMFEIAQQSMQGNAEPPAPTGDGWDPAIGFLGNAGKAIFGGLQEVMKMAASDPRVMGVLAQLVGRREPSQADLAAYAYREEQRQMQIQQGGGALPPPVNAGPPPIQQQPQYQQQPQQYMQAGPMPPPVRPPMQQQSLVTPPPMQQAPAPVAPQTGQPTEEQRQEAVAQQTEIDVATALEGESAGVNLDGVVNTPPPTPAPVAPPTQAAQPQAQPAAQPAAQPPAQPRPLTPEEQDSENRLRDYVSATMSMAITDIVDERLTREWHNDAHENWNGKFKRALLQAPNDDQRVLMIERYCDPAVWARLRELIAANGDELAKFYQGLHALLDLNKAAV